MLQQKLQGSWSLLVFFSKKLSTPESNYSTFDTELLAASSAARHFRVLLEGREFTDHKPLTHALFCSSQLLSTWQQHYLVYITEFTSSTVQFPLLPHRFFLPLNSISQPQILIFPPCLLSSPPALLFSPCCPALPSLLSLSFFFGPPSSVMCPPDLLDSWFQLFYIIHCSFLFTGSLILALILSETSILEV